MPSFGQNFLKGFTATQNLRDYTHASKTFTTNYYELKPRFKFLFTVKFNMNVKLINALTNAGVFQATQINNLSLAVKTVDLPKYEIKHETLNQYNRKRVVQSRIDYSPVNITFHDDGGDNIRQLWYQYYSYYYKDPSQQYGAAPATNGSIGNPAGSSTMDYNQRDIYAQQRSGNNNDWGFIGENFNDATGTASGKPPFFTDITIFGFDQHKYARYVLINPIISAWQHDTYDYSQGNGIMQHTMTINYETVKYYSGALGKPDQFANWPDVAHYDNIRSPIARPGSTSTVFGQGGLVSTVGGIMDDLEKGGVMGLLGAAQKAGAAYNTFKGKNLKSIVVSEATALGKDVIQQGLPGATRAVANKADGFLFPVNTGYGTIGKREYNEQLSRGVIYP